MSNISKTFKYVPSLNVFNRLKVSATEDDSAYKIGESALIVGKPDILYENIAFISDEKLIWTHGEFYNKDSFEAFTDNEIEDFIPSDD